MLHHRLLIVLAMEIGALVSVRLVNCYPTQTEQQIGPETRRWVSPSLTRGTVLLTSTKARGPQVVDSRACSHVWGRVAWEWG